jgi:hypothetical protein
MATIALLNGMHHCPWCLAALKTHHQQKWCRQGITAAAAAAAAAAAGAGAACVGAVGLPA